MSLRFIQRFSGQEMQVSFLIREFQNTQLVPFLSAHRRCELLFQFWESHPEEFLTGGNGGGRKGGRSGRAFANHQPAIMIMMPEKSGEMDTGFDTRACHRHLHDYLLDLSCRNANLSMIRDAVAWKTKHLLELSCIRNNWLH